MNSIIEAISFHAKTTPDRICLADYYDEVSYSQAWKAIRLLAWQLIEAGVKPKDCVMIECTQDVRYSIAVFSVQLAKGIAVPLEKKSSEDRIRCIREETNSDFFIGTTIIDDFGKCIPINTIELQAEIDSEESLPNPDDIAEILYSTGTTGKSKGIIITHGNNVAIAENVINGVQMKENGVELIPMPLSHSHGLRRHYSNLMFGNTAVLIDGVLMVKRFFELMDRYHVTAIDLSPSALQVLLKLGKGKLESYREQIDYIQIGTAPLNETLKEELREKLPNTHLYNFYGSTEGGCSCIMDFSIYSGKPGCIGKPTLNAHFVIVDENRKPIKSSKDHTGYLAYSGTMNTPGYWRQPELTASVMENGMIFSKDVSYIDEEGFIYMLGRDDDVINYSGIKISPEEIEAAVLKCDGIADCACVSQPDPMTGQSPKLFVVMKEGIKLNAADLVALLRGKLDANKLPKTVAEISEIPRTSNGKILRRKLRE